MGRIDTLLAAMTIEEKIGQLNMVASTLAVTGPAQLGDIHEGIRSGRIGGLLNHWGADAVRSVQRLAVEESRLGIPLLLGLDVIHGHGTIFPVPLAEACLFAPDLWEQTARAAAEEATEDGVALTFAPMVDVARDPRWGRIVEGPGEDTWVASQMAAAKTRGFQSRLGGGGQPRCDSKAFVRLWPRHCRAANMPRSKCPSERCARSISRHSPPPWLRAWRRSCRRSLISRACR